MATVEKVVVGGGAWGQNVPKTWHEAGVIWRPREFMTLTYLHSAELDLSAFLPLLTKVASELGVKIMQGSGESADLHFISSSDSNTYRTGLKIAFGHGWTPELKIKKHIQLSLTQEKLDITHAEILLQWMKERRELRQVSPLRHELGNFVVILLGRIMRMKEEVNPEHIESLETLHKRMAALYQKFDDLNVPRYESSTGEN